jgi:hypothetical protein
MTDKIKLVYDWYGPHYPLSNNQIDLKSALTLAKDKDNANIYPSRTLYLFKDNTTYEYAFSHTLKQDDYFLYELTLNINDGWLNDYSFDLFQTQCNIPDNILEMIKNNNGYFLLEACHDSINLDAFFDNVHILFINHKVPINKAILLLGHANAKEEYNKWCENRGILPIDKASIFSYQWGEINASKEIQNHIPNENLNFYKRSKTFLCYNRKTKPHRSDLLALFYKFDVLADSYFSMPEHCVESSILWKTLYRLGASDLDMSDAKRRNIILDLVDVNKTDALQALFPLNIDGITKVSDMEKIINQLYSVYDSTLISVVTESNFVNKQIYHSEKTWKPIANKHPFIIVGPAGSLEKLKSLGYRTFSDFWDESYDLETNDTHRLLRIASLCKSISKWSISKKKDFFYESMHITKHNYKILKSIYTGNKRNDFVLLDK